MAEKSILIADQTDGKAIATRDSVSQDVDSNNRLVQLMDRAIRPISSFAPSTPFRDVTARDDTQFAGMPWAALKGTYTMAMGDAESVAIAIRYVAPSAAVDAARVHIIPIVISDLTNAYEVGFLAPKFFQNYSPDSDDFSPFYFNDGSNYWNFSEIQTWDLCGASFILPFISWDGSDISRVQLWMWPISGNSVVSNSPASTSDAWKSKTDG